MPDLSMKIECIERSIIQSKDIDVSFEKFPYHLNEITKNILISSSFIPLNRHDYKNFTSKLPTVTQRILLQGAEDSVLYRETIAKALAKHFDASFLVYDVMSIIPTHRRAEELMVSLELELACLAEVIAKASETSRLVIFLRNVDKALANNEAFKSVFRAKLEELPPRVLLIGSHFSNERKIPYGIFTKEENKRHVPDNIEEVHERSREAAKIRKELSKLFPNNIKIQMPHEEKLRRELKSRLKRDEDGLKSEQNLGLIKDALTKNGFGFETLDAICLKDLSLTEETADKIACWALAHRLSSLKDDKPVISCGSIIYGLGIFRSLEKNTGVKKNVKKALKDIELEGEFEENIIEDVIPAEEIGVSFNDIGALDHVKNTLQELVMLPLQRPELFCKGQLTKPCKGILLFGPPGTGKTMLAKAVATETGANFINISLSSITSRYKSQAEQTVRAIFSLASKLSPTVIFIDEVDSMLSKRDGESEHAEMRGLKNEFMVNWDGLATNSNERVLILAATNRPFDLDEAVIRRLPRRIMVDLPDAKNRSKILRVILSKEEMDNDVNIDEIGRMTEGYSGSDLKNLCTAAAYCPLREVLQKEKKEREQALEEGRKVPPLTKACDVRPLNMSDFRRAHEHVHASVSAESTSMTELNKWNELYGEGGSRKTKKPTYIL